MKDLNREKDHEEMDRKRIDVLIERIDKDLQHQREEITQE